MKDWAPNSRHKQPIIQYIQITTTDGNPLSNAKNTVADNQAVSTAAVGADTLIMFKQWHIHVQQNMVSVRKIPGVIKKLSNKQKNKLNKPQDLGRYAYTYTAVRYVYAHKDVVARPF